MNKSEITHLQNEMNAWVRSHKDLGRPPLRIDGEMGALTLKRIREVKYDLGYAKLDETVDENFYKRMHHPTEVHDGWGQNKAAVARGKSNRRKRRIHVVRNRIRAFLKPGIGTFDGIPVAKTAIPVLRWCREHGGWKGKLVSGYRTPAYSEHLCFEMCGQPSCPGRCAGRATNHAYATPQRFAIDVSDYVSFGQIVRNCPIQPKIHNALPNDLVHFSPQGN